MVQGSSKVFMALATPEDDTGDDGWRNQRQLDAVSTCQPLAPSMRAASVRSSDTLCSEAIYWQRLLIDVPGETYQNGAYWATATGWIAWCLHRTDPAAAARVLRDVLHYFRQEGSFECVNTGYQKLGSFVVSATNVLGRPAQNSCRRPRI